jgi:nickel superoxide dismutase
MKTFMKWTGVAVVAALMLLGGQRVWAHCQIPCGIYDDQLRTKLMAEDITTIEKSMQEIIRLSAQAKPDNNQLVRWVVNKEDHVARFNEIVTYYFKTQEHKHD